MKTPALETDRLILRPTQLSDAPAIQKNFNNWEIIRHLNASIPWPYPDDGAETFIKNVVIPKTNDGKEHFWVLVLKNDLAQNAIGCISFGIDRYTNEEQGNRGFWLAEPYWGQGLMTEAVESLNDYVFNDLKIDSYIVVNAIDNIASRRVKEKTNAHFLRNGKLEHHGGIKKTEVWKVTPT